MSVPPDLLKGLLGEAQRMKESIDRVRQELGARTVTGSAGGGLVTAIANGHFQIVRIAIEADAPTDDRAMLADLVAAAVNDALRRAREMAEQEMARVTGGLSIPGLT